MWKSIWAVAFLILQFAQAHKVLVVFPFPGKSHGILGNGYVRTLLEDGHEVTYISPFPYKTANPNFTLVDVSENKNFFAMDMLNVKALLDKELDMKDIRSFWGGMYNLSIGTASNENVQKLMRDPKTSFDVVIVEWMFSEVLSGFSAVFNCPYIWSSSMEPHWMVLQLIDEIPNPSYNIDTLSVDVPPLTFTQRVAELFKQVHINIFSVINFSSLEKETYEKYFGPVVAAKGRTLPPFEEVKYNASLMLGNSHVSLGESSRLPQIYKPIGGYHIDPELKPLPEHLKKIMDNSKHGVIYFSMGSNLKSKDLPDVIKKGLLKMFGGLDYTVLWKFEEELENMPKNVHILKWAPQPSILADPNCAVFITHGGLLSTTEAIHYGVPIIGIPVFADQFINVGRAVRKGFAKEVTLSYDLVADLKDAIEEILGDAKYTKRVKELSFVYHDRPASPGAELRHWVRHVIATRGAPHLRSPALLVPWYQKLFLDLAALVFVIVFAFFYVVKKVVSVLASGKKLKKS